MRLHLQQTERTALLYTHPTWPDIQSLSRKRKSTRQTKTANNRSGGEQIYRKELRQMQLWEPRVHLLEQKNSTVERTRDTEVQVPTQESIVQLQQIQRWLDESTMEEIQELHQARRQTGSTLLRTLHTSKLRQRQQQRSDRYHRQGMDETPEESRAVDTVTTVTAVTQWLTWITEMEMHQTLRQQLEHPNAQYHLHLEATYTAQHQQHQAEEAAADGGRSPDNDMYMPAVSPNQMEPVTNIMERVVPIIADPPDQRAITTDEAVHQPQASSPQ